VTRASKEEIEFVTTDADGWEQAAVVQPVDVLIWTAGLTASASDVSAQSELRPSPAGKVLSLLALLVQKYKY
jgi:NADH dehydrogenase FAD-containing subunit